MKKTVVVVGASPKEERYSNKAVRMLLDFGHHVLPINPQSNAIYDQACYPNLTAVQQPVDTVTLYVGPARSVALLPEILALKPKRIIMNPGAESDEVEKQAQAAGIEVVRGCTLVMLQTHQF